MSLYKYLGPDRTDILLNARIRFAQASVFNDPFEMQPFFEKFELSVDDELRNSPDRILDKAANLIYSSLPDDRKRTITIEDIKQKVLPKLRNTLLNDPESVVQQFQKIVPQSLSEILGVLSLTEKRDNLLMWAHYAQNHEGFVIEFDENHTFFHRIPGLLANTDQLVSRLPSQECGYLRKVEYFDERPNHSSILDLTPSSVLLAKSKEWEYEQEWRMFRLLEEADETKASDEGSVYLFSIPPDCIKGLILGCRMSPEKKSEIIEIIKTDACYSHVKVYATVLDERKFALNLIVLD